ncbi:hypothetical protein ACEPAI_6397 [Sanghuangporus weigelae]
MQCAWTSTANVLRRQPWRKCSTQIRILTQSKNFSWTRWTSGALSSSEKRDLSSVADAFLANAIRDTSVPPSLFTVPEDLSQGEEAAKDSSINHDSPSPAKISRIAAQAVRVACQGPSSSEAFLILKSLLKSVAYYGKPQKPGSRLPKNVPIDFGMAVSPRLATHSLLHGLIRRGMTKEAGDIARRIVLHQSQMRLSNRTLQAISTALCQTDALALRDRDFHSKVQKAKSYFGDYLARPTAITESKVKLPCTRVAMQLFFAAKQYRKHRARQMFQQLIDACLLQGEILIVSFLLAFLVKQWQTRFLLADKIDDYPSPSADKNVSHAPASAFTLKPEFLSTTLSYIIPIISGDILPNPQAIRPSHEEAVQALAILAGMLHEGTLRHNHIDGLVKTLVLFDPSASVVVWTLRKGKKEKWERRRAREYFDEVLDDLFDQVTGSFYGMPKGKSTYWANVETFNSLLNYSFRRKKSPAMAEKVVKHMRRVGGNLAPNITTYNIALKASTVLRRYDITRRVIETLRERPENAGHAIMYLPPERPRQVHDGRKLQKESTVAQASESSLAATDRMVPQQLATSELLPVPSKSLANPFVPEEIMERLSPAVQRIFLEEFDLESLSSTTRPLLADGDTLASYINYLTVSGRPEAAVELVLTLLPELKDASYPPGTPDSLRLGRRKRAFNRRSAILRAVGLGPLFFSAALNALAKAGKTGLAERTWRLAKTAEGCSWDPTYKVLPWILPCAVYTLMMKCYAAEARKAYHSIQDPSAAATRGRSDRALAGWGILAFLRRRSTRQSANLLDISRDMGAYILRSRKLSETAYRAQLISYLEAGGAIPDRRTVHLPVADERFYNAALDLFGRVPGAYRSTRKRASPRRLRRLERRQLDYFMQRGSVRFPQDSRLISLLRAMREDGYETPVAYRHTLVGVDLPPPTRPASHSRRKGDASRIGLARSTRLYTIKERGLPVRNAYKLGRPRVS